jgi:sulfur-oxidizing protein SoxZ
MPDPMKIRATVKDGVADVRVLVAHEMETGLRKDAAGKLVPAWHVTDLLATLNGKPALKAYWGTAISKNPFLQFKVKGAKAGDKVVISWVDNRGEKRSDEAVVTETIAR